MTSSTPPEVIFLGNGPLADYTLETLLPDINLLFHARRKEDLAEVERLKQSHPSAFAILASFGVIIPKKLLQLFEPTGILNLHPSLLPDLRGASPIESAILRGDNNFSYSIMKLAPAMDAGPVYYQDTLEGLPLDKPAIYQALASAGATWLLEHLSNLPAPIAQDDKKATFCGKFDKSMSFLHPEEHTASELLRQIIAYQGYPKPKYEFFGKTCIILKAHLIDVCDVVCDLASVDMANSPLMLKCADRNFVVIDELQPEGKKPMDAVSFINGYGKKR